ncbi:MAG: hypothetical protein M1833_005860 [Piccolia ochrophora]|nr:MAG: hypothetical protein M1833_005860 [Piccolia ochrophora]
MVQLTLDGTLVLTLATQGPTVVRVAMQTVFGDHFLASHNISAHQIRQDYETRRRAADQENEQNEEVETTGRNATRRGPSVAETKKRKRNEEKAVENIKAGKKNQKEKNKKKPKRGPDDDSDDEGAWDMYEKSKPLPGQREKCAICSKTFTVTPYSKAGLEGGLLCTQCAKDLGKDEKSEKSKKKRGGNRVQRRQMRSDLLDGQIRSGSKSLSRLCIQKVANSIYDVESFGDLPPSLLEQLSQILSKQRVLNSHTLDLFLRPEYDTVTIHDAAALTTGDFQRIFAICPGIKKLRLENAGQFKSEVLDYITNNPAISLTDFRVGAANLVEDEAWQRFFTAKGRNLESIKLSWIDVHFNDGTMAHLVKQCPKLKRVKFERLWKVTHKGIESLAGLKNLEHLTLERTQQAKTTIESKHFVKVLKTSGPNLRTLCLAAFPDIDDDLLAAIHENCHHLSKLRIKASTHLSDAAFVNLFTNWTNPALTSANFQFVRDNDANQPQQAAAEEQSNGLCSAGFEALMAHSGSRLERLEVTSCRHISHAAFANVFDGDKIYPCLKFICVSFCGAVDDIVLAGVFKSCPKLEKVQVFACFDVKDVVVPQGVVMIGRPNAQDDLAVQGDGRE